MNARVQLKHPCGKKPVSMSKEKYDLLKSLIVKHQIPAIFLLVLCFISMAQAQNEQVQDTQDTQYQTKVKGDRTVYTDKSKPVRRALGAQYDKIADAQKSEDIEALRALRTADFIVKMPNGETWDLETSLNYSRRAFEQVDSILSLSFTIDSLDVHGHEAVCIIRQQWTRLQMKQGKQRRVETSAVQRETWVNMPDGWKLRLIDRIQPGVWIVDGKRVDPSKPYDPDAPPYDPDEISR